MSDRFEDISRHLAGTTSRRGVLKMFGAAAGAAVAASVLKPFRASAAVCSGAGAAQPAPCSSGQTPCGSCCCKKGVACIDAKTGHCGCPAGTTQCGDACCKAGVACSSVGKSTCAGTNGVSSCNNGGAACGNTCCPPGQSCSGGVCGAASVCTVGGDPCGTPGPACPNNFMCSCADRVGGGVACYNSTGTPHTDFVTCASDADCTSTGAGFICIQTSCGTACAPPCSTGT